MLRGKILALNEYIRKVEKLQINNLSSQLVVGNIIPPPTEPINMLPQIAKVTLQMK